MTESVLRGVPPSESNPGETSLRELVTALLPQGFAKIVQPIASTTISTDTAGLTAGEVKIQTMTGPVPAYRAMPEKGGKLPLVLVVQEIFGVHEHIKDVCRRFAKRGYMAVAPSLYHRQGDVTQLKDNKEIFAKVVSKVPDDQVMRDLDSTMVWASKNGGDNLKLGVTGFCWGGRITWLYTAHNPRVRAGVAWYGRLMGDKNAMNPYHPIDVVKNINAPVLGLYGGADAGIPNDTVAKMNAALKSAQKASSIHLYPDTPHAFHADYRPSYRFDQALDGWARCLRHFSSNGVA